MAAARARAVATFDALQDRLEPRALLGSFAESAVMGLIGPGTSLLLLARGLFRRHPVAVAGAGVALALAFFGRKQLSEAKVDLGESYEPYSDFDDDYSPNTGVAQGIAGLEQIDDHPIAAVAAGLAAGALIGALFPGTSTENKLLGQQRARVTAAARAGLNAAKSELKSRNAG